MTKSLIEKELEAFFANDFCPNCGEIMNYSSHYCKECNNRVSVSFSIGLKALNHLIDISNSTIKKAREELRKNANCYTSGIHICEKHPEDCDLKVDLEKIEEILGKEK